MKKKILVKKLICLTVAGLAVYALVKHSDKLGLDKAIDRLPAPVKDGADKAIKVVVDQKDRIADQAKDGADKALKVVVDQKDRIADQAKDSADKAIKVVVDQKDRIADQAKDMLTK